MTITRKVRVGINKIIITTHDERSSLILDLDGSYSVQQLKKTAKGLIKELSRLFGLYIRTKEMLPT